MARLRASNPRIWLIEFKCARTDSNRQPSDPKTSKERMPVSMLSVWVGAVWLGVGSSAT
jgi:hypothetical protein